jgi:hypothetical protein
MLLTFSARDVLGQALNGLVLNVSWSPGGPTQNVVLPGQADLPDKLLSVELQIPVSSMMPWRAGLLLQSGSPRWRTSDPTIQINQNTVGADVVITLSRARLAPVWANNPDQQISFTRGRSMPVDYNPQAALVDMDQAIYRGVFLNEENIRTIGYPGIGDPGAQNDWARFRGAERPTKVKLDAHGRFVLLEYGDPPSKLDGLRFLVGAWAPFQFAGHTPVVIVQLTPNTTLSPNPPFGYPLDAPPFGRVYPYALALINRKPTTQENATGHILLKELLQPYCSLPAHRTVVGYKVIYQVYAARQDVFGPDTDEGPVMITPVPVALSTKEYVQRAPFDNLQGMARLVREVLHFLASSRLSAQWPGNQPRLRFRPPVTDVLTMPAILPIPVGPPAGRARITVLTHSAGILAVMPLVPRGSAPSLATSFPASTWAAPDSDFWQDWQGMWLIDGVGNPGHINSPVAGSATALALRTWAASGTRRLVAVYTSPSGIATDAIGGLVDAATRKSGPAGWIEEGRNRDGSITWLRMLNTYLTASTGTKADGNWPTFGDPANTHDFVYNIGVGYAAASGAH